MRSSWKVSITSRLRSGLQSSSRMSSQSRKFWLITDWIEARRCVSPPKTGIPMETRGFTVAMWRESMGAHLGLGAERRR